MPIFRKIVTETSTAIFDIEANSQVEADNRFAAMFRDPDMEGKYDDYRDLMNGQCKESFLDGASYRDRNEYDAADKTPCDFFIEQKQIEPKYDLYIKYIDKSNLVKAYLECGFDFVLDKLREVNRDYILKPTHATAEAIKDSINHGCLLLYYVCERRN